MPKPSKDHHFKINHNEKWLWRYSALRGSADGWTEYEKKKVLIHRGLRGRKRLQIELHEGIHMTLGHTISEEAVTESAKDLAKILWALGYRMQE
jgi:hypothetical protein